MISRAVTPLVVLIIILLRCEHKAHITFSQCWRLLKHNSIYVYIYIYIYMLLL